MQNDMLLLKYIILVSLGNQRQICVSCLEIRNRVGLILAREFNIQMGNH